MCVALALINLIVLCALPFLSHMVVTACLMQFPESGFAGCVQFVVARSFVALASHWVVARTLQASLDDYDLSQSAAARFVKATSV